MTSTPSEPGSASGHAEQVGELKALQDEGKIGGVGISEASADALRRANAAYRLTALQSEYSLWTREIEREILPTARQLGIGFVAYSPLGRGFRTCRREMTHHGVHRRREPPGDPALRIPRLPHRRSRATRRRDHRPTVAFPHNLNAKFAISFIA